jgi:hypothetical protein
MIWTGPLMDTCVDTPFGPQILRRFVELVDQRAE